MQHNASSAKPFWPSRWWWWSLLVILVCAGGLRYTGYNFSLPYVDHVDEPAYNIAGRMIIDFGSAKPIGMQGYPPGIVTLNYVLLKLFQDPATPPSALIGPVRLISITFSLGVVLVIALLGYRVATPLAGLLAACLWAITPRIVEHSRYATADNFVTFFTLLALFLMLSGTLYDRDRWNTYGTVSIMCAVIFKYQAVFVVPLIVLGPLWRLRHYPERPVARRIWGNLRDNILFLGVFFVWLLLIYPSLDAAKSPDWSAPVERLAVPTWTILRVNFRNTLGPVRHNWAWTPGILGVGLLLLRPLRNKVSFFGLAVVMVSALFWEFGVGFYGIQAFRQYISSAALVTLVCCIGLAAWAALLQEGATRVDTLKPLVSGWKWVIPGLLVVGVLGASWPEITASIENARRHTLHDRRNDLATYMDTSLLPGPYISDPENHKTFNRAWGGYAGLNEFPYAQTAVVTDRPLEDWRTVGVQYAIVPYYIYQQMQTDREYQSYLSQMLLLKSYPPSSRYRGPSMVVFRIYPIQHPAKGVLGPIRWVGYDLNRTTVSPGESFTFTLYWKALTTPDGEYAVFNHLVPLNSRDIVGQIDGPPLLDTRRPTTLWNDPDETLVSRPFTLVVGKDVSPGEYRLITGFYRRDNGQRLFSPSGDDFLLITTITVAVER